MKKALFLIAWMLAGALPAWAVDDALLVKPAHASDTSLAVEPEHRPLRESMYSVSSEDFDQSESLNRISGKIDLGFSGAADSYVSSSTISPGGPTAREQAAADIS